MCQVIRQSARNLLIAGISMLSMSSVHAFKIGDDGNYQDIQRRAASHRLTAFLASVISKDSIRFGDPIHEEMVELSFKHAEQRAADMRCKPVDGAIKAFIAEPQDATVKSEVCCNVLAESSVCNSMGRERHQSFPHPRPHITGVRWPDDPCHMTISSERTTSRVGWAMWMVDGSPTKSDNMNYSSHFHDKGFMHAMASIGRNDPSSYREDARATKRKIIAWAEFTFRVAEGSIPASTTIRDTANLLDSSGKPSNQKLFRQAFGSSGNTIGWLFTGKTDADERHVRQIALAALLHTIQDSFSASHVTREYARPDARKLEGVGKVVRFLLYRPQVGTQHGIADGRPDDWDRFEVGALHPVPLGAELIACAAAAGPGLSKWTDARTVVARTIELVNDKINPPASAGGSYFESNERPIIN